MSPGRLKSRALRPTCSDRSTLRRPKTAAGLKIVFDWQEPAWNSVFTWDSAPWTGARPSPWLGLDPELAKCICSCSVAAQSPKPVRVARCRQRRNSPPPLFLRIRACVTIQNMGVLSGPEPEWFSGRVHPSPAAWSAHEASRPCRKKRQFLSDLQRCILRKTVVLPGNPERRELPKLRFQEP